MSRRFLAVLLAPALLAAGCRNVPPEYHGDDVQPLVARSPAPAELPADVALLPIENNTGRTDLPLDKVRRDAQAWLVHQRYSPLALEYVDAQVTSAGYRPRAGEGVVVLAIDTWDDSRLSTHGAFSVDLRLELRDAGRPDPENLLWAGRLQRDYQLGVETSRLTGPRLVDHAFQTVTRELLNALPPRDPEAAAR